MAMSKAQRQKATNEMISIINSRAEAARRFRDEETLRRPAIEKQEVQEKRDEEITKMALCFSLGLLIGTVYITAAICLLGIHPVRYINLWRKDGKDAVCADGQLYPVLRCG